MAERATYSDISSAPQHKQSVYQPVEKLSVEQGLDSPARRLQSYLDTQIHDAHDHDDERWSLRQTAFFVIGFCTAAWVGIWMIARALVG